MRRVLLLARNDLRLTMRDRVSFFWMLVFPVTMMWFFGQMGGREGGAAPKVALTVVDRDGDWLARALVAEVARNVVLRERDPSETAALAPGERRLVIPEGFTANALAGRQQKLAVAKTPTSSQDLSPAPDFVVLRAIVRTLGRLVELNAEGKLPPRVAPAQAAAEMKRLAARERLVSLEVTTAGRGRPVPSGTAQSVPGILTMTVLMMTVIYGGVFLSVERREGMLRRQVTLPMSRARLFLGKIVGRLFVALLQVAILIAAGRFVFGVDFGHSPAGLALLLLTYSFSVAGIATFCGAVFRTAEQAAAVGWIASMVMAALGGCWWPSEVMPRWLWRAAHVFPTAWAMDAFHALISFGRGLDAILVPAAVLVGFGLVFGGLAAHLLDPA